MSTLNDNSTSNNNNNNNNNDSRNKRSHKVIQYYMDPDLGERAPTDSNGNLLLNFGTVLQGQEKRIKLFAKNTIEYDVQLEPLLEADEPDLKITRYPAVLRAGEVAEVIVSFKPDIDRVRPLESGFDFRKIILARNY